MPEFGTETLQFAGAGNAAVGNIGDAVEAPFNADVTDVVITAQTAPTGADLVADVLVNGTSVFAAPLGTVATVANAQTGGTGGIADANVTTFLFDAADGARQIQSGEVILIDTEKLLVSNVQGSSQVAQSGGRGLYQITVQRGYDGTTAAAHAAGANVLPAKPFIPAGATKSAAEDQPFSAVGGLPPINKGDVIQATVTQVGSTVAGAGVEVEVVLTQR